MGSMVAGAIQLLSRSLRHANAELRIIPNVTRELQSRSGYICPFFYIPSISWISGKDTILLFFCCGTQVILVNMYAYIVLFIMSNRKETPQCNQPRHCQRKEEEIRKICISERLVGCFLCQIRRVSFRRIKTHSGRSRRLRRRPGFRMPHCHNIPVQIKTVL